jgi:DNA-binding transcriptional ArsR family regulator
VNVNPDLALSRIAAAIGEPARVRMLYSLTDGHARTSTELAVIAQVAPSTASTHLACLRTARLITMAQQGKHRYYRLAGSDVAAALERLNVLAGGVSRKFIPTTPPHLRAARTCYDHIAGRLGVGIHNRLLEMGWMVRVGASSEKAYELTEKGIARCESLGIDVAAARALRRKFAYPCLDWSERQPHIGGALGAALLERALKLRWVAQDPDARSLQVTRRGEREMHARLGIQIERV